jgi:hypothetical protein
MNTKCREKYTQEKKCSKEVTENFQFINGGSKRKHLIHITGTVLRQNILYSDQAMAA